MVKSRLNLKFAAKFHPNRQGKENLITQHTVKVISCRATPRHVYVRRP